MSESSGEWLLSGQVIQRAPPIRDARTGGRDRYLGTPPRYEGRERHAERRFAERRFAERRFAGWRFALEGGAGEHEPEAASDRLHAGRDAGIRRGEAETVPAFEVARFFTEAPGEAGEVSGGDASAEESRGVEGQRRRDEEASGFEGEVLVVYLSGVHRLIVDSREGGT